MIVALDFESYYSTEFSLSRMSEAAYILDARFETIMCAVKLGSAPSVLHVGHEAVAAALDAIDWSQAALLSHNTRFDGAILHWIFGHVPKLYLDTLSMARALVQSVTGKCSLKAVAAYLGVGEKGDEIVNARGKRLADFTPVELARYGEYCINDNELCRTIFDRFRTVFPASELSIVDAVIRMYVQPAVRLDPAKLVTHAHAVLVKQAAVMETVSHIDRSVFSSNLKFAALLEEHGVDVPMKPSTTPGKMIPALAKNDRAFKEMCEDPDYPLEVQALFAARLGVKSTIELTRTKALLRLSQAPWGPRGAHWMPVPLRYSGAHTHRLSGDGGFNFQNLRRDSPIRDAIEAPPGHVILHRDSSQIEARGLAMLAGCKKLLDLYELRQDTYCAFASSVYGRKIVKADKLERFVGKTCTLGLGYQTGAEKLRHTLFIGNGGISVRIDLDEAARLVRLYRTEYREIPELWSRMETMLRIMVVEAGRAPQGLRVHGDHRPVPGITPGQDALWLPNGLCISYPQIRFEKQVGLSGKLENRLHYTDPFGGTRSIYGGKATENICQALARIVIMDVANRVVAETGVWPFLSTHDSLDYCVPEAEADWWDAYLEREFAVRPSWAPDWPLASEGGYGRTLAEAEANAH